ncbi:72a3aa2f-2190-4b85-bf05-56eaeebbfd7c [Thermothielavioides terrestris]|uniref:72a3aa2f-2190-4b85-bf05-56eaeebbfd7c n=1 Tax=Thermothielavioides terrestris TaxID=2587410 RepID=A0A3S4D4D2_9PEZI|nr:72a3aa2f-2190-4b85-bf05-56eaeebbfd7c [Thermothielavioides terrestris]
MSLLRLPYELLSIICEHLDLRDIYSLSFSCKRFQFLLYEPNITKLLLESKAPHSTEARDARISKRYAAGLRRLIKRREAVASVSPYLVAIVAFAEEWLYSNGVLCYLRGPQLRILDLHRSGSREMVVDTRKLFREALEGSRRRRTYQIQLLYQSHNIVSCVYGPSRRRKTRSPSSNWLVAFDPLDGQIKTVHRLESVSNLFVRNNERFLYYGTTSAPGHDGYERWVIGGFDLAAREWLGELTISAVIGTDIGSSVCFEILDGFLK